jgi:hypothetical protein
MKVYQVPSGVYQSLLPRAGIGNFGKVGVIGALGLALLSMSCSSQQSAQEQEQLGASSQAILQGTPESGTTGGYVVLYNQANGEAGSGVLLTNEWVLTAGHVAGRASEAGFMDSILVDLGNTTRRSTEVYVHPLWITHIENESREARALRSSNKNVIDAALVKVSPPFPGGPFRRDITALSTPELIDTKGTTRCHAYGPNDIDLSGSWFKQVNPDGTITEPTRTRADFTMLNHPPGIGDSGRDNRGFTAIVNPLDQTTYRGDSGGPCVATSGTEEIYGIIVSGTLPPCMSDSDCTGPDDRCIIPPGETEGDCRTPIRAVFEAAQSFRGFAEAHVRQHSTLARLTSSTASDRITLRVDGFGNYVVDFELEGFPLVTLPTGVADTQELGNVAQVESSDFDGDGIDDLLVSLDGSIITTGEFGRFGIFFSSSKFNGAWQPFLDQLLIDVVSGTAVLTRDYPFIINSTFAFIESTGFDNEGLRATQLHGGTVEFSGSADGLVRDLPPRGFDYDGDGLEDIAAVSNHRVDVTLGDNPPVQISMYQADFAGSTNVSLGDVAWGDFDGSCSVDADDPRPCQSELVVASPLQAVPGHKAGAVHYFKEDGTERTLSRGNLSGIPETSESGTLGTALAVGDFNADGYDDLAVGTTNNPSTSGVVVISGGPGGLEADSPVEVLEHDMFNSFDEGMFGYSLTAGDFNCDGVEDLAIGQPYFTDFLVPDDIQQGAVVVVYGGSGALATQPFVRLQKGNGLIPGAPNFQDALGTSLAAGNFDGDTFDGHACVDLVIAAEWEGRLNDVPDPLFEVGGVYVVHGNTVWDENTTYVQHLYQGSSDGIEGERTAFAHFGHSLAVGRMNEDRFDDLIVGQPDVDGENGGVHVLLGADLLGIGNSGHRFFQLGSDGLPDGTQGQFGAALGSMSRGLVAVGAPRLDPSDVTDAGHVSLLQFAETEALDIGQTTTAREEVVSTVGELFEDFFTRKPAGSSVSDFLLNGYADEPFDDLVANHRFGSAITSARPPFETPLFSKRTDLGRVLNLEILLEAGGIGRLKEPRSAAQPAATCFHAKQTLDLRDRAVLSASGTVAGTGLTLSANALLWSDVKVAASASARDGARIQGDVTLAGTLSLVNGASVTGSVTQNASVSLEALSIPSFTAGTQAVTVNNDQTRTLLPGSYGHVLVRGRGSLVLGPGTYNFASLTLEDGELVALNAGGPTLINVVQTLELRDRSKVSPSDAHGLRFNSASTGTVRIGNDAQFDGFVAAPNASVEVGSRARVSSCIAAKTLTFQPEARIRGLN